MPAPPTQPAPGVPHMLELPQQLQLNRLRKQYKWDAFISYSFDTVPCEWVKDHFAPRLRRWLKETNVRPSRLALSIEYIGVGDNWRSKLREVVAHSACLIAIVTPSYVQSRYCRWEWKQFAERAERAPQPPATEVTNRAASAAQLEPAEPRGRVYTIAPVVAWGSPKNFDPPLEPLREIQSVDFSEYVTDATKIDDEPWFGAYQCEIRQLANRLQQRLLWAPAPPAGGWKPDDPPDPYAENDAWPADWDVSTLDKDFKPDNVPVIPAMMRVPGVENEW